MNPSGGCGCKIVMANLGAIIGNGKIEYCHLHHHADMLFERFQEMHQFHALHNEPISDDCSDCLLIKAAQGGKP